MFLLSNHSLITFRRGKRKGSRNKRIKHYLNYATNHDKLRQLLNTSRETRNLINTALTTTIILRHWFLVK